MNEPSKLIEVLQRGGVILHPTETCYGLATLVREDALQRLAEVKGMPLTKPVSLLVRDLKMAQEWVVFSPEALALAEQHWPGPLTLILPKKPAVPEWLNPGLPTLAVRVSPHASVGRLLEGVGEPLTTTSANVHGEREVYAVAEALEQGLKPDGVLDEGILPVVAPSTMVRFEGGRAVVLRQGPVVLGE